MALVKVGIFGSTQADTRIAGRTVREVLERLVAELPDLRRQLFNDAGKVRSFVTVYLNDEDISYIPAGENTPVGPNDRIAIAPAIAGGGGSDRPQDNPDSLWHSDFDTARLIITLTSSNHSLIDVTSVVESLENLVMASIWGSLAQPETTDETLNWARNSIQEIVSSPKAQVRFFPYLPEQIFFTRPRSPQENFRETFSPVDPLDVGVQVGLNTMLRRVLRDIDRRRYERLFSFAQVTRLEHNSPLLLETMVVIGAAIALPAVLLYGCMSAVSRARRAEAEAGIRETELQLKQEELKQSRLRTQVQEHIVSAIKDAHFSHGPLQIPETVLAETTRIATTTVADLQKNPLIGSVTLGLSKGK